MKPNDLLVRCMAWRDGDLWIAASIDFGLVAQAYTPAEAKQKLHEQISSYVTEALGTDRENAEYLLSRKAPAVDQLRYAFWWFLANRPSLRAAARRTVGAVGLAIRNKMAYKEPMPIIAA